MNKIGSVWRHMKTLHDYKIIAVARSADNPDLFNIVYSSLEKSTIRGTGEPLPIGTCWIRKEDDFYASFQKISDK